jgi:hypothetical protein
MEKQGMKALYFDSKYKFDVIEINEHETVICTSLEQLTELKQTHINLIAQVNQWHKLQRAIKEANDKGLISKRLAKELKGLV